jgi:Asp-tRNA(Asn)/Glu-tRNA(Gln) amidotransferase A subunit family amidase
VNPYDPSRTPGGSSSGSGATVGAGLLDIALGTQTAGSLCRPAAYCGAVGLKPGRGALPTAGMTPLAPSFDMPGLITRTPELAAAAFTACTGIAPANPELASLRIGLGPVDPAAPVEPAMLAALEAAGAAFAGAGAGVTPVTHPFDLAPVVADHRCVMLAEAAMHHGHRLRAGQPLRPNFRAALETGLATPPAALASARGRLATATAGFWSAMAGFDALLTLVTPAPAPPIGGGTGYMAMLVPWTVFGGPLLCLPWGVDAQGLPLSVMLAGRPGTEALLLGLGIALAPMAPALPKPMIG